MAKSLEQRLAALTAACADPTSDAARRAVREALQSSTGVLIASAAGHAAAHQLDDLDNELCAAFSRLLERPTKRDPGCRGKVGVARALYDLDRWVPEVFAAGVRYVQREPVWGGSEDTAAELRAICGYAYACSGHPATLRILAELLADSERTVRSAAARALADAGRPDADALLRYKLLCGDPDPEVMIASFAALCAIDSDALAFIERFLSACDPTAEAAILGLGESRLAASRPLIIKWCETAVAEDARRIGYLALALLRDPAATTYLLESVATNDRERAIPAIQALATFRDDEALAARVREASRNASAAIRAEVAARFSS
ncbi:MAG TPA: HEAT repeat domain-containing protein [Kofleriaceae bacterium]|nr:HEAT repeat domain-containing protein [Kofleriaceae bacterium]